VQGDFEHRGDFEQFGQKISDTHFFTCMWFLRFARHVSGTHDLAVKYGIIHHCATHIHLCTQGV